MFQAATRRRPATPARHQCGHHDGGGAGDHVEVAAAVAHLFGHDAAAHERVHRDLERQPEGLHGDERPQRQLWPGAHPSGLNAIATAERHDQTSPRAARTAAASVPVPSSTPRSASDDRGAHPDQREPPRPAPRPCRPRRDRSASTPPRRPRRTEWRQRAGSSDEREDRRVGERVGGHWVILACRYAQAVAIHSSLGAEAMAHLHLRLMAACRRWCHRSCRPRSSRNRPPPPPAGHVHYTAAPQEASPTGALAPRLQNLGSHVFPVSTRNRQAQQFVNQGLNLAYAFNHAEARRAFREAARLDPDLAMAYWGQALVLGPEHQRADGAERGAERLRAGAEGDVAALDGPRRASAPTSRRWPNATRAKPRIAGRATRPTRPP